MLVHTCGYFPFTSPSKMSEFFFFLWSMWPNLPFYPVESFPQNRWCNFSLFLFENMLNCKQQILLVNTQLLSMNYVLMFNTCESRRASAECVSWGRHTAENRQQFKNCYVCYRQQFRKIASSSESSFLGSQNPEGSGCSLEKELRNNQINF